MPVSVVLSGCASRSALVKIVSPGRHIGRRENVPMAVHGTTTSL
jgi:hypothetical protein